ncbi:MAG: hypothetical protein AB7S81_07030 [Bdellovibrionales bacterium]
MDKNIKKLFTKIAVLYAVILFCSVFWFCGYGRLAAVLNGILSFAAIFWINKTERKA